MKSITLFLGLILGLSSAHGLSVYHVGNSLTFQNQQRDHFRDAAEALIGSHTMGSHIDEGQNLTLIRSRPDGYEHLGDVGGPWNEALRDHQWDVVVLQPHTGGMRSEGVAARFLFIEALDHSEATRCYIYETWPYLSEDTTIEDWWDLRGKNQDTILSKPFFDGTRREAEGLLNGRAKVNMIPVGSVLEELQRRIEDDEDYPWDSVLDFYTDHIHFNQAGSYIVVSTWLATIFQRPSADFNLSDTFPALSKSVAAQIDELVWDVVKAHPAAGVRPRSPFLDEIPGLPEWDGTKTLDWFGAYTDEHFPYVYSARHGWIHINGDDPEGFHAYSISEDAWLWMGKTVLKAGWIYHFDQKAWIQR